MATKSRGEARLIRKARVRRNVRGTNASPRLCVYRSLKFTYAQLISDETGEVIVSASTKELGGVSKSAKAVDAALALGKKMAELAQAKKVETIVFDRNGYVFHGRIKAVADGAREGGLKF